MVLFRFMWNSIFCQEEYCIRRLAISISQKPLQPSVAYNIPPPPRSSTLSPANWIVADDTPRPNEAISNSNLTDEEVVTRLRCRCVAVVFVSLITFFSQSL